MLLFIYPYLDLSIEVYKHRKVYIYSKRTISIFDLFGLRAWLAFGCLACLRGFGIFALLHVHLVIFWIKLFWLSLIIIFLLLLVLPIFITVCFRYIPLLYHILIIIFLGLNDQSIFIFLV